MGKKIWLKEQADTIMNSMSKITTISKWMSSSGLHLVYDCSSKASQLTLEYKGIKRLRTGKLKGPEERVTKTNVHR